MAMSGAMSAAVSGLKAHMEALNVVGNNVANVNTYGYKAGRVTFRETIYSTQSVGAAGTDVMGGTNPRQTGYGCNVGTIDLDMSTQSLALTGLATDCAIQGDGFFLVGPKTIDVNHVEDAKALSLSRVGDFKFIDGYLVDGGGNVVYGFLTSATTDPVQGGDPGATVNKVSTDLVPIKLPQKSTGVGNPGDAGYVAPGSAIYVGVDANGNNVDEVDNVEGFIEYEDLSIDENGMISCVNKDTGEPVVVGYIALASVDNPNGLIHSEGPYYTAGDAAGDINISAPNSSVTGALHNQDPTDTTNTPTDDILAAKSQTSLMTGFLEDSGTDLATEFSNMIIYQRGYQANTRIVTVTDTMLEELVNMKR